MGNSVVACGQVFPHAVVERIKAAVRDHPQWTRADLARNVCDWLDWRAANGKDKAVNCRVALVRLERRRPDYFAAAAPPCALGCFEMGGDSIASAFSSGRLGQGAAWA